METEEGTRAWALLVSLQRLIRVSSVNSTYFGPVILVVAAQDKPAYVIPTGDAPLWEPSDELVLSKLWPHIVKHFLNLDDSDFRCDPSFPFIVSNMLRLRDVFRQLAFRVPKEKVARIATALLEIDMDVVSEMIKKSKDTKRYKATTEADKHIERIPTELQSVGNKIHGTTAQMLDMRNEIRGYVNAFERRAQIVAANPNPAAAAEMFDITLKQSLKIIVRADDKHQRPGLFGKHVAHYGVVETQMRGTLHAHMLIWLEGHPSPNDLRKDLTAEPTAERDLVNWLESLTQQAYPGQTAQNMDLKRELGADPKKALPTAPDKPHPALRKPPALDSEHFPQYIADLANAFQSHIHNSSCIKNQRPGVVPTDETVEDTCRYRINGTIRAETSVDIDTGKIELKRLEPRLDGYNPLCLELLKCNTDVTFAGFGELGRAILFYVTLYVNKTSLSASEAYDAVHVALQRCIAKKPLHPRIRPGLPFKSRHMIRR
ncbi:BQ5605_C002g00998 [Microbotryum silenes-dioicae]|uniref:BQ5605_C002g00998 protein n=1 Tax=Microbotryum silenes-dioicae TaxID=796604 RepID=A0A2X0P0T9_9BASI|nr:BQ5605_C002g00998 [Microbotryum silenes-dioicae]